MPGIIGADSLGRYHSVTRQLLRKADGVVLMYDVTSQESFVHVRYWLDCLQVSGQSRGSLCLSHSLFCPGSTKDTTDMWVTIC